jgi:hypothetical protein
LYRRTKGQPLRSTWNYSQALLTAKQRHTTRRSSTFPHFCCRTQAAIQLIEGCINLAQQGALKEEKASVLPKLAGRVWETCEAVKKTPASNQVAVGRGLALLAATVKDTLREMGDMKETTSAEKRRKESESGERGAADGQVRGEALEGASQGEGPASRSGLGEKPAAREGGGKSGDTEAGARQTASDGSEASGGGAESLELSEASANGPGEQEKLADAASSLRDMRLTEETPGEASSSHGNGLSDGQASSKTFDPTDSKEVKLPVEGGKATRPAEGGEAPLSGGAAETLAAEGGNDVSLPDDLGDMAEILDYNPEFDAEDMELVRATVLVTEGVLALLKQLLYVVAKWAPPDDWSKEAALNVLEMLHGDCR